MNRRGFITGLVSLVAAPAIVRAGSLMPVRGMVVSYGIGPMMTATEVLQRMSEAPFPGLLFDIDEARASIARMMRVPEQWLIEPVRC